MSVASLFDPIPPYQPASTTSISAAASMVGKTQTLRDRVLAELRARPLTDEGISVALNLNPSTARPRRIELVKMGLVYQVGTRVTFSGRNAALWSANKEARA